MIAALFVDPAGPYVGLPNVDPWDEKRDARSYAGADPVVAHPPCERWGRMARGAPGRERFEIGDDGGCFKAAVAAVRRRGGVIEHPQGSHAFHRFGLPIPPTGRKGWSPPDAWGGRSCYVDQGAYGHMAKKPTWLYAVLPSFPSLNWHRVWDMPFRIGGTGYHSHRERERAKASTKGVPKVRDLPAGERHLTPPAFRDALLGLAASCEGWTPKVRHVGVPLGILEAKE